MEPLDELFQTHLVLIIGQLGQLLHRAVRLVSLKHNRVQELSQDENVINLFAKTVLLTHMVWDIEEVHLGSACHRNLSFALGASFEDK